MKKNNKPPIPLALRIVVTAGIILGLWSLSYIFNPNKSKEQTESQAAAPAISQPNSTASNNAQISSSPSSTLASESVASAPASQDKSADTPAVNRKEVIAEAQAILRDIKAMESEGRGIPRRTQAARDDCMNKINERWQRAKVLKQRVEKLPKLLQIYLGTAANELINCVSCDSDALSLCSQARDWIKEAEKDIAEYERGKIQ